MGFVKPSLIHNQSIFIILNEYFASNIDRASEALADAFCFIVNIGWTISITPIRQDFEILQELLEPVALTGISGSLSFTHGGTIKFDCITSQGNVVTIITFGY